jgi:hypothetical protein
MFFLNIPRTRHLSMAKFEFFVRFPSPIEQGLIQIQNDALLDTILYTKGHGRYINGKNDSKKGRKREYNDTTQYMRGGGDAAEWLNENQACKSKELVLHPLGPEDTR